MHRQSPDMRRAVCAVLVRGTAACLITVAFALPTSAQQRPLVSGAIETGAAAVEQPLVRRGTAFYVAPSAQLRVSDLSIGGDAVFATGTPTWKSFLGSGYVRSPAFRNVRVIGTGQLLKTSGLLPTLHGDVGAEWRGSSPTNTAVVRARAGQMRYGGGWWRDFDLGASAIHAQGAALFVLDATFSTARRPQALQQQLGVDAGTAASFSAQTLDLTPRMIWERSRVRADASIALRAVESGVQGTRVGPQLSLTLTTGRGMSLFVGGVQRLPDARSGIPGGRSALLGLRFDGRRILTRQSPAVPSSPSLHVENGMLLVDAGSITAGRAALRGDFTEWKPRACVPRGARYFDCGSAPPAGTWRVAIRLDDGAWQQPGNLAAAADDFGSVDGVLMTGGKP